MSFISGKAAYRQGGEQSLEFSFSSACGLPFHWGHVYTASWFSRSAVPNQAPLDPGWGRWQLGSPVIDYLCNIFSQVFLEHLLYDQVLLQVLGYSCKSNKRNNSCSYGVYILVHFVHCKNIIIQTNLVTIFHALFRSSSPTKVSMLILKWIHR